MKAQLSLAVHLGRAVTAAETSHHERQQHQFDPRCTEHLHLRAPIIRLAHLRRYVEAVVHRHASSRPDGREGERPNGERDIGKAFRKLQKCSLNSLQDYL